MSSLKATSMLQELEELKKAYLQRFNQDLNIPVPVEDSEVKHDLYLLFNLGIQILSLCHWQKVDSEGDWGSVGFESKWT